METFDSNKTKANYTEDSINSMSSQCQFFVVRKKRLCRMTVRPGRHYCGEHEPEPEKDDGKKDTRIPCPNDPKHTCYISKLQKHLTVCNARPKESPPYIIQNINAPQDPDPPMKVLLSEVPKEKMAALIEKINQIYDEYIKDNIEIIEEQDIHEALLEDFQAPDRTESSRRHLRQVSSLLHVVEREGLVRPGTCYVELGAGKGHLSYYAWRAWCSGPQHDSGVLLLDRASLRHKRDNKLPHAGLHESSPRVCRVRADLAHVSLEHVPAVSAARTAGVVGLAKHLCGVGTDYALRCVMSTGKARGVVLAPCCLHRCRWAHHLGAGHLQEMGIDRYEFEVMLRMVSWATCGHGRPRAAPADPRRAAAADSSPETGRERAETGRERAETGRERAETGRERAETGRERAETGRERAETGRERAETGRERAETGRERAETGRERAETGRERAETGRERAETGRERAETGRERAETGRERAETGRERAETGRERAETGRERAETGRERAETGRERAETGRERAETGRERAETGRERAETGRERAETGRRARLVLELARVRGLRAAGLRARLCRLEPAHLTPENICIVAARDH